MHMIRFRVQNYKNVNDTDWVNCGDLTCFVGKNEAGKSAIFRGLSKLNPSDGEKYDGLKEFPRTPSQRPRRSAAPTAGCRHRCSRATCRTRSAWDSRCS